jgi:hypothetical protein
MDGRLKVTYSLLPIQELIHSNQSPAEYHDWI